MYNNLTFLNNPVNKAHLLIHLTIWTFSVDSILEQGLKNFSQKPTKNFRVWYRGTRDEVLYAAARDGRRMMEDGRCFCCRLRKRRSDGSLRTSRRRIMLQNLEVSKFNCIFAPK